mgnify:FL=1
MFSIKRLISLITCVLMAISLFGQTSAQSKIAIAPFVSEELDVHESIKSTLEKKLMQMATQNGFGASSSAFVITPSLDIIDKYATATVPSQFVVEMEVSFFVVNIVEDIIVSEISYEVKGVDTSEQKAIKAAINQVNVKSPRVRKFMEASRAKIVEYYADRVPVILEKAEAQANIGEYENALATLNAVPESVEGYSMVLDKMTEIYLKKVDKDAKMVLQEAKAKTALKEYNVAMDKLLKIPPTSSYFEEASNMFDNIKSDIDEDEKRRYEVKIQRMEVMKEASIAFKEDKVAWKDNVKNAAVEVASDAGKSILKNVLSNPNLHRKVFNLLLRRR